jgi:guanylate kinase
MIVTLTGPSAVGKDYFADQLCRSLDFDKAVSFTTRQKRKNEKNGVDYHFCEKEEINRAWDEGELAERAHVHGEYYGVSRAELEKHENVVFVCDPEGARQVKLLYGERLVYSVLMCPTDFEVLAERLEKRESSKDKWAERYRTELKWLVNDTYRRRLFNLILPAGDDKLGVFVSHINHWKYTRELVKRVFNQGQEWLKSSF